MKNKNIILGIVIVLIVIVIGISGVYLIYRNNDGNDKDNNEINVEIKKIDDYTVDVYINKKLIFDDYVTADGITYEIIDNLVYFTISGTSGGGSSLYVYNAIGEEIFKVNNNDSFLPNKLIYTNWTYDKENKKILIYSKVSQEEAMAQVIDNKYIDELTCAEIEEYKNTLVAEETYELLIKDNKYELKSIDKTYLKDYAEYSDLVSKCSNIKVEVFHDNRYTVIINNKTVLENFDAWALEYEIINDIIFVDSGGTAGASNELHVYNSNGVLLYSIDNYEKYLSNNLIYIERVYDKENDKNIIVSRLFQEEAQVDNISGKRLEELTCSEIEYYKDKIIVEEIFELSIINEKVNLESIGKYYLSEKGYYVNNEYMLYEYLKENCSD